MTPTPASVARHRTPHWWRSTSFRLTLANAVLLALCFSALLALVTVLADRFMVRHVTESVEAELRILASEYGIDGRDGVVALIAERTRLRTPAHARRYRLEDDQGRVLAGNLDRWPQEDPGPDRDFRSPSALTRGTTGVMLRWTRLPDRSRLLVGFDEIEIAQVRGDIRRAAAWGLAVTLLIALAASWLLTRMILRPVEGIRDSALRILDGDLEHRIALRDSGDAFDRLAATLNAMLDRIQQLIASVRGATDNIAHDLRSPLTRHRTRLEAALSDLALPVPQRAWIEKSLADVDQVLATFQSLLRIASVESGTLRTDFTDCDIAALITDAVEFVEPLSDQKHQAIEVRIEACPPLRGHRDLLFQALINLLDNAIKYAPDGSPITVGATRDGDRVRIAVADRGPGIPAAERRRVFERLYRLDRSRNTPGLGLGLSLVEAIARVHRGSVEILDHGPGTQIVLTLPLAPG